jgi:two-component sensor histidine kinase
VRRVKPEHPAYTDGREVWLEETAEGEFDSVGRLVRVKGLTLDVTARRQSEDQQSLLIAALDDRVQNLLARVTVVAKDMCQGNGLPDADIQALDRRIQSMADAYTLLSQHHWKGVDLAELVRRQLAPIASDVNATIGGPNVTLTASATQALAMVLHELVTNAAKYGALSTPHGRVDVNWHRRPHNETANLSIVWREIGGPTVAASPDCRYGVRIIRELLHEFGGSVDLAFASSGVCCKIDIPIESIPSQAVSRPDGEIATMPLARADEVIE